MRAARMYGYDHPLIETHLVGWRQGEGARDDQARGRTMTIDRPSQNRNGSPDAAELL